MSHLYVVVVYLLNAVNGDIEEQYVSSKPMTAEACLQALSDRGGVPVKDGLAQYAVCKQLEDEVST